MGFPTNGGEAQQRRPGGLIAHNYQLAMTPLAGHVKMLSAAPNFVAQRRHFRKDQPMRFARRRYHFLRPEGAEGCSHG
jgi:hypothetical protein